MNIRFDDHPAFHRAALGMTAGSAALGIALYPATPLGPMLGGLFGIAVGAAIGYGKPALRVGAAALASVPLIAMPFSMMSQWPVLAACAGVLALGTAFTSRGLRGAAGIMFSATIMLLAMWTALRFDHSRATAHWPSWANAGAASAAMGIVGAIAMLPRHFAISSDPVRVAIAQLPAALDAEIRALCTRTIAIWTTIEGRLPEANPNVGLARDAVIETLATAATGAPLATPTTDDDLSRRMADLDQRIAATTDDEVKAQYTSALAALADQRAYRERIRQSRERLVARLHNQLAALEKFQLAGQG